MAKIALHKNFIKNFYKLPNKVQKRVSEFVDKFQKDPYDPSLHLHPVKESMLDKKVHGANLPDGYRAIIIVPDKGDTFLLVHIDTHDEAYNWARNKRFEVHEATGIFQIFDVEQIEKITEDSVSPKSQNDYPLSRLSEEELFQAGVPHPLIPAVMAVRNDDDFDTLAAYLPSDCRDVLYGIAAGMSLDESIEQMLGSTRDAALVQKPETKGDFTAIDQGINYDLVLIDGQEELRKVLDAPLDEWRVFLHPYQKKLVYKSLNGPMNITGAAGTGKTVALIHRAVNLARLLPNKQDKILFTTFTTNLPITIRHQLKQLAPEALDSIEVINLHALARNICIRTGWKGTIITSEELSHIFDSVMDNVKPESMSMIKEEMISEYNMIIDPNGIDSEEAYLTTVRTDRPKISRAQRKDAWNVFREIQRALKQRNMLTAEGSIHQARLAVESGSFPRYRHVLVDEVQDFSLEALRLIYALSPIEEVSDPLTMAGDGHQRIYRKKIPLSRAGINVRGRSYRLKINYRTSEQIRGYAQGILAGIDIDDLDGGTAVTLGDHSLFKGPEPRVVKCESEAREAEEIRSWVQSLIDAKKYDSYQICIAPYKPTIVEALTAAGITTYRLRDREADPGESEPGIRIGSIHRIKGLEFRAVALACSNHDDPMNRLSGATQVEKAERYVAITRAREEVLVTVA